MDGFPARNTGTSSNLPISMTIAGAINRSAKPGKVDIINVREIANFGELNANNKYQYFRNNSVRSTLIYLPTRKPEKYRNTLNMFQDREPTEIPQRWSANQHIEPDSGTRPPYKKLYGLSEKQLLVLHDYMQTDVETGWITASSSSTGVRILFVKKKDVTLHLYVDYRGLKATSVRDSYPLPLMDESLDHLKCPKVNTILDIHESYYHIRVTERAE